MPYTFVRSMLLRHAVTSLVPLCLFEGAATFVGGGYCAGCSASADALGDTPFWMTASVPLPQV
jgi:hypothetical protein